MEPRSYLSRPPGQSESRLLHDLYALNRQFIALLLETASDATSPTLLEPYLLARLATLSEQQLQRLATCPYSLFDIRFDGSHDWRARPADEMAASAHTLKSAAETTGQATFALCALLYARQLADHYPDLARLLLGMNKTVAEALASLSLPSLARIAFQEPHKLEARLARHPHFWPDLIDFVREGTQERHLAAQTLGVQQSALKL